MPKNTTCSCDEVSLRFTLGRLRANVVVLSSELAMFRAALNFLPTQRLTAWMDRYDRRQPSISPAMASRTIDRVQWAIDAVGRHAPLTFACFPRSLAAYFMLRRRHIVSKLFYGVARGTDRLTAHTWVKVGDCTVVGGEVESQFTILHTFP